MSPSPALLRFVVLLCAGFLGAAATGKLVPHARWLTEYYGISLGMAGLAISAVMLPGAVLSAGLGVVADRLGAGRVTVAGLALGGAASLLLFSGIGGHGFATFIWLRLVEGIGYCLLVVGATMLVVQTASPRYRTLALAVWSSFAPIGFALGQWAAARHQGSDRLLMTGIEHGCLMILAAMVVLAAFRGNAEPRSAGAAGSPLAALRHAPALLAALSFGCSTGVLLAAVAAAPLVLARSNDMSVAEVARLTALAALPGIAGRFAAGWLLGRRMTPVAAMVSAGIGGMLALGLALLARLPLGPALALFALFQVLMGIIPGVLSAMIPLVAPSPDRIGTVSGLINQCVTTGNLIGPPAVLSVYALADVEGALALLAVWTALCGALVVRLAVFRTAVPQ